MYSDTGSSQGPADLGREVDCAGGIAVNAQRSNRKRDSCPVDGFNLARGDHLNSAGSYRLRVINKCKRVCSGNERAVRQVAAIDEPL